MLLMHEQTSDGSWSDVEVFVATPDGKVDVRIVKGEGDVSDGVSEVEAAGDAKRMAVGGDPGDVEGLAGVELDAGEHY